LSLAQFIAKWTHEDYPPEEVAGSELDAVEARFGFALPEDYRQAILAKGVPRPTIALLSSIVAADLDLSDVSDFFAPAEVIKLTEEWRGGGLPAHLVAFANDCSGNLFCFDGRASEDQVSDLAMVLFWNHDDGDLTVAADNFTRWIERFCAVERVEDDFQP
jgi:hypothetical protein